MPRKKQRQYDEAKQLSNIIEAQEGLKKNWYHDCFSQTAPLTIELGCGKGDYSNALAERFPEKNFIGIDIKGYRLWYGAKAALERNLSNVCFFRTQIQFLEDYFAPQSVDEIWITFPDPHHGIGTKHQKKRLTAPRFLKMYKKLLKPTGSIHLKTDAEDLYEFSLQTAKEEGWVIISAIEDIYAQEDAPVLLREIQTTFERKHLAKGRTIYYLQLQLIQ